MVSDALCGTAQSSEDHTPLLLSQEEDDLMENDLLLKLLPISSSPRLDMPRLPLKDLFPVEQELKLPLKQEVEPEVPLPVQAEEIAKGKPKGRKAAEGGATVSSLVLHRGENWSKEELRRFVNQRKKQKSTEVVQQREGSTKKKVLHSSDDRNSVKMVSNGTQVQFFALFISFYCLQKDPKTSR